MSLKQIAHHLQAAGRNNDSMLVHMSPREVSGLQALARQHGGDLSINPNTGLVEAGFLDSILPTIAGIGLSLIPGVGPLAAAGLVGGGTAVATGSLEKGLIAGLGAYGGAGIGQGLSGASTLPTAAPTTVTPSASAIPGVTPNAVMPSTLNPLSTTPNVAQGTSPLINNVTAPSTNTLGSGFYNTVSPETFTTSFTPDKMLNTAQGTIPSQGISVPPAETFAGNFDKVGSGFSDVTSSFDKVGDFASANKGNLLMSAAPMAYSMANPNSSLFGKDEVKTPTKQKSTQRPYSFSTEQDPDAYAATDSTAERSYFLEPRFTALPTYEAKNGGLMSYGVGGQVDSATLGLPDRPPMEQASMNQSIGNNNSFPMSQMRQPAYSSPINRPIAQPVIDPSGGVAVDPYTGQQMFAKGGVTHYEIGGLAALKKKGPPESTTSYKFDPETQQYTKSVTDYKEVVPKESKQGYSLYERMGGAGGFGVAGLGGGGNGTGSGGAGSTPFSFFGQMAPKKYEPVTTETKVGGMAKPYQPKPYTPSYKNYEEQQPQNTAPQMGDMGDFYSQMNQQLGMFSPQTGGLGGYANGGMADGGYNLGGYSDGGRLLKGPGDGVSDSIPASIGDRQPARLADGEFVVPARIVSELGNGSTDAGARKLYAMMDRVQKQRGKTTGKGKVAVNSKADKYMPA